MLLGGWLRDNLAFAKRLDLNFKSLMFDCSFLRSVIHAVGSFSDFWVWCCATRERFLFVSHLDLTVVLNFNFRSASPELIKWAMGGGKGAKLGKAKEMKGRVTQSARSNLVFPVGRIHRYLKERSVVWFWRMLCFIIYSFSFLPSCNFFSCLEKKCAYMPQLSLLLKVFWHFVNLLTVVEWAKEGREGKM